MPAHMIDGKAHAQALREALSGEAKRFLNAYGRAPGLAVVLVGEHPASAVYVRNKVKACQGAGIASYEHRLPATVSETELLALVALLNSDDAVDGILVQLPLPAHIAEARVIEAIDPAKDVDGFHPVNAGRLAVGLPGLVPCTPLGCVLLAKTVMADLAGREVVVIGRSNIVGKPAALLFLQENATVTIAHSRTRALDDIVRRADIVVAAVGRPEMVRGAWLKPGAVVIDVGINRVTAADGTARLVGDVAFDEALERASAITPVPGGVGPMTIACLLRNTLTAACLRRA